MTKDYEFHEVAGIFPIMSTKELTELAADIEKHGQCDEIILYEGQILDGRNRHKACRKLGVETLVLPEEFSGTLTEAVDYVMSHNLHRRQLTTPQRGMVAAKSMGIYQKAAKKRKLAGMSADKKSGGRGRKTLAPIGAKVSSSSKAVDQAAQVVGCGSTTVERCARVLLHGAAELVKAVETKEVSANAADLLATTYTKEEQQGFLKGGKEAVATAAKKATPPTKAKAKKKPKPDALIKDTVKAINRIMDLVRKKGSGVSAQRENTIKRLTSARDWIKAAGEFL